VGRVSRGTHPDAHGPFPAGTAESWSWVSGYIGYIEGKAARVAKHGRFSQQFRSFMTEKFFRARIDKLALSLLVHNYNAVRRGLDENAYILFLGPSLARPPYSAAR